MKGVGIQAVVIGFQLDRSRIDSVERVCRKDELANEMADIVTAGLVSRDLLAMSDDEGLIVALATVIINEPLRDDVGRWLKAAPRVRLKHVAYRMVVALTRLLTLGLLTPDDRRAARAALQSMRSFADLTLVLVIERAELLIELAGWGKLPSR